MKIWFRYRTICLLAWLLVSTGCRTETFSPVPNNNSIAGYYSATDSVQSSDRGRIVYVSFVGDWNGEIYVMNDDGSEQTRLTYNETNDNDPVWSPDGREIAFTSNRDGLTRVYVMNADGSQVHRLTDLQDISEGDPAWSPDGKWIVFSATTTDGHGKTTLQLVNLVSGEIKELVNSEYILQSFSWSPDSQFIWFPSLIDQSTVSRSDLYTVHIESGDIQRITYNGSDGWIYDDINVSPDGLQILHGTWARDPRAFILDVQTLGVSRALDYAKYKEVYPELVDEQFGANWSPDGNAIVFSMTTDDIYTDLYVLDFQSEQITQLTSDPGHEMSADWWKP